MLSRGHATPVYGKPVTRPLISQAPSGPTGTKVHVGTGAPSTAIGVNGDMYLDSSTGNWYGPKEGPVTGSGTWGGAIP